MPVVAITDMTLYEARNWSSQYRCIIQNKSQKGQKGLKQSKKIINPITGKKQRCAYPYDNISLVFIDDKYGNFIRYYHLMSTPLVPGFSKGNCAERKFQSEIEWSEGISLPENCGGIKYKKVKKGEVIGKMGHATKTHVSLGIGSKNLGAGTDGVTRLYLIAPEDNFEWENLPTNSDAYLFPVMSKKYLGALVVLLVLVVGFYYQSQIGGDDNKVKKVGFIYVGPVTDFGWTYEHDQGRKAVVERFGENVETTYVESVEEGADAERAITQMARDHDLIFTTSFGYMLSLIHI